ncbi:hypothetical protein MY3296_007555 [Beauveria thailandica]
MQLNNCFTSQTQPTLRPAPPSTAALRKGKADHGAKAEDDKLRMLPWSKTAAWSSVDVCDLAMMGVSQSLYDLVWLSGFKAEIRYKMAAAMV